MFFSIKRAEPRTHPIPNSLDRDYVTGLLHNERILSPIFWPSTIITKEKESPSQTTINHPNPNLSVSISKTRDGVVYREKPGGGFTTAITYTVVRGSDVKTAGNSRYNSYLLEERTVRALWPISGLVKFQSESPKKTKDLVKFLDVLGRNGRDVTSALETCAMDE